MSVQLSIDHLPESARDLIDIIGLANTLKIIEARGGLEISIPIVVTHNHWLVELIGYESLQKLSEQCSGLKIDVPRCVAAMRAVQYQEIYDSRRNGISTNALAQAHGYTARGIRKVVRRIEDEMDIDDPQEPLF